MLLIEKYIGQFPVLFPQLKGSLPWEFTGSIAQIILDLLRTLDDSHFTVKDGVAIHKSAVVEQSAIIKAPAIIGQGAFVAAHTYLRGGVYLGDSVCIGPGCEVKSSIICSNSSLAHFNYVGDSLVGSHVNFEAGTVVANHYNERNSKKIIVKTDGEIIDTGVEKFGALVGDYSKIGANAVLSPGSILLPRTVVKRLELVDQLSQ